MENFDVFGPLRKDDEKNFHIAGKDLKMPIEIQDLYWQMDDIRRKMADEDDKHALLQKVADLGSIINKAKEGANDEVRHFLGMVNDELMKTGLKLQMAIKKAEKAKK
jgi:hypothetical protein